MVNDSYSPIPRVQDNNKGYTARKIKRAGSARRFHNITVQLIKRILHAVNNKILYNLSILREDVTMAENIYGPIIPHLRGKTVQRKIQHVDPVKITIVLKTIIYAYKDVTVFCDCMQINGIGVLNTISRHIMFATGSMIKIQKIENISDGIMPVHKLYLHC